MAERKNDGAFGARNPDGSIPGMKYSEIREIPHEDRTPEQQDFLNKGADSRVRSLVQNLMMELWIRSSQKAETGLILAAIHSPIKRVVGLLHSRSILFQRRQRAACEAFETETPSSTTCT